MPILQLPIRHQNWRLEQGHQLLEPKTRSTCELIHCSVSTTARKIYAKAEFLQTQGYRWPKVDLQLLAMQIFAFQGEFSLFSCIDTTFQDIFYSTSYYSIKKVIIDNSKIFGLQYYLHLSLYSLNLPFNMLQKFFSFYFIKFFKIA